jgi:phosphoglycerate kinase
LEQLLIDKWGSEDVKKLTMHMMENLRFNAGEEANGGDYAEHLSENREFYINEAFAASHRSHASIVTLPKLLSHAMGLRFEKEIENLSKLRENPTKPFVVIISGIKEDKLGNARKFAEFADKVLIAGRLPELLKDEDTIHKNPKVVVGHLLPDKEDITIRSIEAFEEEIGRAGTVYLAGPLGKFEEEGHRLGTKRVFEAVAKSDAYKVAGGGDTVEALDLLGLTDKFDWVSVGGGASLEFLINGTLPGIEALK